MSSSPANFYHLFADGQWEVPVREHLQALESSGFSGQLLVGLVGSRDNRLRARRFLAEWEVAVEADSGFEQVTLRALHAWAASQAPDTAVLYAHAKGSVYSVGDERSSRWRHALMHETVTQLARASSALRDHDVAGAGWQPQPNGFFFGNFWWARADYIAGLKTVSDKNRYMAEYWIGTGNPRVADLCPDFLSLYEIGWDYDLRSFGMGRDCSPDCPLLLP